MAKTSQADVIKDAKATGIRVLGGSENNKYPLVPLLQIHVVERPEEGHDSEQLFYNPRDLDSMDSEGMLSLRDSIAKSGLHTPLTVRAITSDTSDSGEIIHIDLVAGERRLRSLFKLYEDNEEVYDWRTKERKPARQVYAYVPCEVWYNISDEEALSLAWMENFERQPLTVQEEIHLVERLIRRGLRQEEIAVRLNTNVTWVSQTYNFRRELPQGGFERLLNGRLSRHVAVQLLSFHKEDRENLLCETIRIEQEETEAAKKKTRRAVEDAEDEETVIIASAKKVKPQKLPQFRKKLATAARKIIDAKAKQEKVDADAGTIRQGHLQRGAVAASVTPRTAKVLTKSMIQQFLIDTPLKWAEIQKLDPHTHQPYPPDKLMVIINTAQAVLTGNIDTGGIIRKVMVELGDWEMPEGVEEQDPELLEIPEGDEELD
jgi:ParB-like chromosome segregation protein Spo0J